MISLSKHIELLLLEHNCVIVPGLGGFIANIVGATYNDGPDGDKLFIPPYRTIAFNPQLQINDGLLVQSYMQAYDAAYPAAYLQMEKEVEQLNMQLNIFGEYHLEGIGTLHKSLEQSIILEHQESGILTPELYGMYSFPIKSLSEVVREREKQTAAEQTNIMPIQTEIDLRVKELNEVKKADTPAPIQLKRNKRSNKKHNYWKESAIAAAVAAIVFLIILIPGIANMNGRQDTVIAGMPNITSNKTQTTKLTEQTANSEAIDKTEECAEQDVAEEIVETKDYTIVLASYVPEKYAQVLIDDLAALGFKEAKFVNRGKASRVIYSAYATEKEAFNAILGLRKQNEAFKDAWPMKMN